MYISIHRVYIDTDLNISFSHIHNHKIFSRINFIRRKSVYLLKNFNIFFCRTIFFRKIFICDIPQSIAFFNLNTFIIDISTFVIRRILFLCGNALNDILTNKTITTPTNKLRACCFNIADFFDLFSFLFPFIIVSPLSLLIFTLCFLLLFCNIQSARKMYTCILRFEYLFRELMFYIWIIQ